MNKSKIEWCDMTWNPVTGCLHGCTYCYARRIAERFGKFPCESGNCAVCGDCTLGPSYNCEGYIPTERVHELDNPVYSFNPKRMQPYPYGFEPTFHRYRLDEPKVKAKGKKIFVCSMADLFGDWVPDEWIKEILNTVIDCPQHTFMFLTKNPLRYINFKFPNNCWIGTTITSSSKEDIDRAWRLLNSPKITNTFLSIEPLFGPIDLNKCELLLKDWRNKATIGKYIDWVIVGAETGNCKNKVIPKREWIIDIVKQCMEAEVPVFLKDSLKDIMGYDIKPLQEFPKSM